MWTETFKEKHALGVEMLNKTRGLSYSNEQIVDSEEGVLYTYEVEEFDMSIIENLKDIDDIKQIKAIAAKYSAVVDVDIQKAIKLAEIRAFDNSSAVNEFTLQGNKMWRVLKEREDMRHSLAALKAAGIESWTYWLDTTPLTMPVAQFEALLHAVEVYAIQCYNVTAQHKANVISLDSVEAIKAYNYAEGYPQKLVF